MFGQLFSTVFAADLAQYQGIVNAEVDPLILPVKYQENLRNRTLLPSIADMLQGWLVGDVDENHKLWGFAFNNVPSYTDANNPFQATGKKLWDAVINGKMPRMSLEQIWQLWYQGQITNDELIDLSKKYKFKLGHGRLLQKYLSPKFDQSVIFGNYLRGNTNKEETIKGVRKLYGCNETEAKGILDLTQFLPQVADIIRFSVRDVYNDQVVNDMQMDAEYTDQKELSDWANAVGLGNATITNKDGAVITRDILKDYWRAHWELMSPTQGYIAYHTLREGRMNRYNAQFPGITPFNLKELENLLRANDYLPKHRTWLAANSATQIGRIDLRRLYESDSIDDTELTERYKDIGYLDVDALALTEWSKKEKKKKKDKEEEKEDNKKWGKYRAAIIGAYQDGTIHQQQLQQWLIETGMKPEEVAALIQALNININRTIARTYIKQVQSEFFLGGYDGIGAYQNLLEGGIVPERASQLVSRWQRQQTRTRKTANTNQLLEWFKSGYIDEGNLQERLRILGWSSGDILILYNQGLEAKETIVAEAEAQQTNTANQAALAAERLARQMQRQAQSAISRFASISSPSRMKKWYELGLIDLDTVRQRLLQFGWSQEDAQRWLNQLEIEHGEDGNPQT